MIVDERISTGTMFLREGPNFDPVKYVKEVSHVEHMHADSSGGPGPGFFLLDCSFLSRLH